MLIRIFIILMQVALITELMKAIFQLLMIYFLPSNTIMLDIQVF